MKCPPAPGSGPELKRRYGSRHALKMLTFWDGESTSCSISADPSSVQDKSVAAAAQQQLEASVTRCSRCVSVENQLIECVHNSFGSVPAVNGDGDSDNERICYRSPEAVAGACEAATEQEDEGARPPCHWPPHWSSPFPPSAPQRQKGTNRSTLVIGRRGKKVAPTISAEHEHETEAKVVSTTVNLLLAAAAVAATPKDGSSTNALFFKLHDHCMNAMDLHRLLVLAMARPLMLHDGAATGKKCNLLWSAPGAAAPPLQQGETGKRK
uniref:Uncharacterized protein n=1 Tax=Oryza sativa subsp. japonica TaxID=39947 RepID=Q7XB61_ORYSJ|nr:hypothetical protein [Oryza sativa Japonica Group]